MGDTYVVVLVCTNCGHKNYYRILKGILVDDYCRRTSCKSCAVRALERAIEK